MNERQLLTQTVQAAGGQGSVGTPVVRADGPLKVAGLAPYAYEQSTAELTAQPPAYLWPLTATIARGKVLEIDTAAALRCGGVLAVLTHGNAPKLALKVDSGLNILQSPEVKFRGQYIGAVLAETPEQAREAARQVRVRYSEDETTTSFEANMDEAYKPKILNGFFPVDSSKGDLERGLQEAEVVLDETYTTPIEHHNPLESHSTVALWRSERLGGVLGALGERPHVTIFDGSQGVAVAQKTLAAALGKLPQQVEIISPYIGGAFGSKGVPKAPLMLVVLAAQHLSGLEGMEGRPVKYQLPRHEMFTQTGHRPRTRQRLRLGASRAGKLHAMAHEATQTSPAFKEYAEQTATCTRNMYAAPHRLTTHRVVPLDMPAATFMRAPGEMPGMFALETAMDELATRLEIDPVELRIINEPEQHPEEDKPFSSRKLVECLREGARLFGWDERESVNGKAEDGDVRGEWVRGMGVAATTYPRQKAFPSYARIRYEAGVYHVETAAADIGTGAWTALAQIAADALEVPLERVDLSIGRSDLPFATLAGGSSGTYTWGSAIMVAAAQFREQHGFQPKEGAEASGRDRFPSSAGDFELHAFGAHFAEVAVSRVTGEVRVKRMLGVYDAGRIINPRTATSQFVGGITMGISAALHEESYWDERFGLVVNHNLADYHIAAHADVPDIQARWLEGFDPEYGPTGAKGIGEIGIVGVPAAISNAIYAAVGVRLRDLPMTPDKVLAGM